MKLNIFCDFSGKYKSMINKKTATFALLVAAIFLSFLISQLPLLKFDYELEKFFPEDDTDLSYYRTFSETFGYDNDYLLFGFNTDTHLFDSLFLKQMNETLLRISTLDGTVKIISPTHAKYLAKTPMGLLPIPLLHLTDFRKISQDSIKLYRHDFYRNMFISKSGKTLKAVVLHKRFDCKEEADEYTKSIQKILGDHHQVKWSGKIVVQDSFVHAVKKDFSTFIIVASLLIFLFLLLFVRNLPMILTALMISGLSLVATIGVMAIMGKKIDVLSSLIPTILLVVSMSDIIHLFSSIQKEYQTKKKLDKAVNKAVREVGLATLLTSMTTAMGFLTLITIHVIPIIDLGIYAAIGIVIAYIITYLIFPSVIVLLKPSFSQHAKLQDQIHHGLSTVFKAVVQKQKTIASIFIVLVILGVIGVCQLKIDAYLMDDLPKNDHAKSNLLFFDQEFSGSKPFTLSLWAKDSSSTIYDRKILKQIDQIEKVISLHTDAKDLISPLTYLKFANQTLHQGRPEYYTLPDSDKGWEKSLRLLRKIKPERKFIKVTDGHQAQISGFFQDLGSRNTSMQHKKLEQALSQTVDTSLMGYQLTGTTLLIDKSHQLLSMNLIKGLLIAMLLVGIIAGWMFRSLRMILITLVPNLFPILMVAGIMGYCGIPLNLSTSVIFAISFGIVVDDTIHFLSRFKQEYRQLGKSKYYAIKSTILHTGQPIFVTTAVLTSGFLSFCFSDFSATFYTGLFVSISFIVALLADLYVLPVLLLWWLPNIHKSKTI